MFLASDSKSQDWTDQIEALRLGLRCFECREGRNLLVEFRWAAAMRSRRHASRRLRDRDLGAPFRRYAPPSRSAVIEIDQENLAISSLCRELAKVFSEEISPRNLRDLKAELLTQLRDLARRPRGHEPP
ncbi:hypothetical protein [Bradyrhizobium yuanmingense]|uniref:Uncharacterized protein n=1 Tax=Bradyrhizobium yuanmingense TaxID=108015 RepID=A0ABV4G7B0_9BRAD|nr:hypothetical protein [Bradyrhizobium yuanmingense]